MPNVEIHRGDIVLVDLSGAVGGEHLTDLVLEAVLDTGIGTVVAVDYEEAVTFWDLVDETEGAVAFAIV